MGRGDAEQGTVGEGWSTVMAGRVERSVGVAAECLAGFLVAVETLVLFAGAVSRYVFQAPLTWTDELASILFLWLSMLGAVVAYRRFENMRMGGIIDRVGPKAREFFAALALAAEIGFCGLLLLPAIEYAVDQASFITPVFEVPAVLKSAAVPAGLGLILVLAVLRVGRLVRLRHFAIALGVLVAVAAVLYAAKPLLLMMGNYRLIVFFVLLVGAGVLSGISIGVVFGLGTFAFLFVSTRTPVVVLVDRMEEGMSHIILLSVPLFVFLGYLLEITGMAKTLVAFVASLIGHVRGGLQYVLVGAIYLVSGISGSKAADMAAVAPVLFPEMKKRGAKPGDLGALLAATGAQTETVPPSLVLITIGSATGVSIAALFAGGVLPSLLLGSILCFVLWLQFRNEDISGVRRATRGEIFRLFVAALPAVALPFLIRAAVVEGITTATEVSTIGVFYCLIYAIGAALLFGQPIAYRRIWRSLVETASLTGAILLIIGTATAMAWALTQSGFSQQLVSAITSLPGGAVTFLVVSIIAFVVLGSVLEGIPAIVLFGPLLFPVARAVGIHEVHYAMVVILAMGIGLFAPPVGIGFYTACAIGRVDPSEAMKATIPYLVALLFGVVLVAAVPWFSTALL
jgi:tripartite ATP-independent transporter DctM subunit